MKFAYEEYYRQDCIVPLLLIFFSAIILIKIIVSMIRKYMGGGLLNFIKGNTLNMLFFIVFISLITINLIHLLRGGIHLLYENQQHAIHISGFIENTDEIDAFTGSKYSVEQNNGNGVSIVVNGVKYYLMTFGDLKTGDYVSLEVLPKSGFILSFEKIE